MTGVVEVDSAIHSFNQESGFITIIKPRAMILINDAATADMLSTVLHTSMSCSAIIKGYTTTHGSDTVNTAVVAGATAALVIGGLTAAVVGIFGGPLIGVLLGVAAMSRLFSAAIDVSTEMMMGMVLPLMRFGNPWIGGLEGYRTGDLIYWAKDAVDRFMDMEIYPLIETWDAITQGIAPSTDSTTTPAPSTPSPSRPKVKGGKAPAGSKVNQKALDAFAAAIQKFEGGHPKDRNMRNNNPGNIRTVGTATPPKDSGGFAIYNTYQEGLDALKRDISAKITGNTHTGLGPNSTIRDFFYTYAPPSDNNPTEKYAQTVANALGVTPDATLGTFLS